MDEPPIRSSQKRSHDDNNKKKEEITAGLASTPPKFRFAEVGSSKNQSACWKSFRIVLKINDQDNVLADQRSGKCDGYFSGKYNNLFAGCRLSKKNGDCSLSPATATIRREIAPSKLMLQ